MDDRLRDTRLLLMWLFLLTSVTTVTGLLPPLPWEFPNARVLYQPSLVPLTAAKEVTPSDMNILSLFGWTLGPIESVIFSVAVGMSVDFVSHLSHAYIHAKPPNRGWTEGQQRAWRVSEALSLMGVSISTAAVSTIVAGSMSAADARALSSMPSPLPAAGQPLGSSRPTPAPTTGARP